eukprot:359841-Chlamydomonas_euryale.AAC.7
MDWLLGVVRRTSPWQATQFIWSSTVAGNSWSPVVAGNRSPSAQCLVLGWMAGVWIWACACFWLACSLRFEQPPAPVAAGTPPISNEAWTKSVEWLRGNLLEPKTYERHLTGAVAAISAVGAFGNTETMLKVNTPTTMHADADCGQLPTDCGCCRLHASCGHCQGTGRLC